MQIRCNERSLCGGGGGSGGSGGGGVHSGILSGEREGGGKR